MPVIDASALFNEADRSSILHAGRLRPEANVTALIF
jgi:hypothetical protein